MPSLPPIRTSVLEDLAAQLRFAPPKTIERQIEAIEKIASEIEPEQNYPEDWLEFRITGYRSEREDPALLVGAAVLADLSAVAEHLAAEAKLALESAPEGAVGIEELCARWNVSRKTVERYRRRGLIARRMIDAKGHVSLVFAAAVIEAFEQRNRELLGRAKSFSRIDAGDRREMLREVKSEVREGRAPTAAVKDVSARHKRSAGAVRGLVRKSKGEVFEAEEGFRSPLSERDRDDLVSAVARGESIGELAKRFGRSTASVNRIVNESRSAVLRDIAMPYLDELQLDAQGADVDALGAADVRANLNIQPILDASAFVEWARKASPPAQKVEKALARGLRALLTRAAEGIAAMPAHAPSSDAIDRIETDLRWATKLKAKLVWMHGPQVVRSLEERLARPLLDLPPAEIREVIDVGFDALMHAVDRFDPKRGGRLAAPVSIAINRAMVGVMGRLSPMPPAGQARRLHVEPVHVSDWMKRLHPWQSALEFDERLRRAVERLAPRGRSIIEKRYGLAGEHPRTVHELRELEGATPHMIRATIRHLWANQRK